MPTQPTLKSIIGVASLIGLVLLLGEWLGPLPKPQSVQSHPLPVAQQQHSQPPPSPPLKASRKQKSQLNSMTIQELWHRIERVLEAHAPDSAKTLAPPASDRELDELEAAIHLTLPADLRAFLKIHNGQIDPTRLHVFCGEGTLLDTREIADRWRMSTEINRDTFGDSSDRGPWWKTTCIPLTDADGNMLCVDMDPELGDQIGEVVCHVHDSEIERGLGSSLKEWLSVLADNLDAGRFSVEEGGYLWLNTRGLQEATPDKN